MIEFDLNLLTKTEKRVWVKPTSKRKGHYRKIKGAKKVDVDEKKEPKDSTLMNLMRSYGKDFHIPSNFSQMQKVSIFGSPHPGSPWSISSEESAKYDDLTLMYGFTISKSDAIEFAKNPATFDINLKPHAWTNEKNNVHDHTLGGDKANELVYFGAPVPDNKVKQFQKDPEIFEKYVTELLYTGSEMKLPEKVVFKPTIHRIAIDMGKETSESGKMIPENMVTLHSLHALGIRQGVNVFESELIDFGGAKGIYKTISDDETFGDVAYYKLSKLLGWDIIPETTSGDFGRGVGSCQRWIPETESPKRKSFTPGVKVGREYYDALSKIFIMDAIVGNVDRHSGNVVFKGGKVFGIDNGMYATTMDYAKKEIDSMNASAEGKWLELSGESKFKMASWIQPSMEMNKRQENYKLFRDMVYKNLRNIDGHRNEIVSLYKSSPSDGKSMIVEDNIDYLIKLYGEK